MLNIAFGQSKYYIDNLAENIKRGHRQKLRKGIWPGFAPLGYLNNHRTKEIDLDKEKVPFIRKAFGRTLPRLVIPIIQKQGRLILIARNRRLSEKRLNSTRLANIP